MEIICVQAITSRRLPRTFRFDQMAYVASLLLLTTGVSYHRCTSVRAAAAWVGHMRPHLGCTIIRAAQVSKATYETRHVQALNKAMKAAQSSPSLALHYSPPNRTTLQLRAFPDASFATNDDQSSELGFINLLVEDGRGRVHFVMFFSRM